MARDILPPTVVEALQGGNKIEAIKRLRGITGLGLKEAKDWIENYERGGPQAAPVYDHPPERDPNASFMLTTEAMAALKGGSAVEAIRIIRDSTGVGLAEATDIAKEIRKSIPEDWTPKSDRAMLAPKRAGPKLAPGQVAEGGGAAKWVAIALVVAAAIGAALYF